MKLGVPHTLDSGAKSRYSSLHSGHKPSVELIPVEFGSSFHLVEYISSLRSRLINPKGRGIP